MNKWGEGEDLPHNKKKKKKKTNNDIKGMMKLENDYLANMVIITDSINNHQMLKFVSA